MITKEFINGINSRNNQSLIKIDREEKIRYDINLMCFLETNKGIVPVNFYFPEVYTGGD